LWFRGETLRGISLCSFPFGYSTIGVTEYGCKKYDTNEDESNQRAGTDDVDSVNLFVKVTHGCGSFGNRAKAVVTIAPTTETDTTVEPSHGDTPNRTPSTYAHHAFAQRMIAHPHGLITVAP
jgi:hypothetical protein